MANQHAGSQRSRFWQRLWQMIRPRRKTSRPRLKRAWLWAELLETRLVPSLTVPIQIGNGAADSYAHPGTAVTLEVDLLNYASPVNVIHLAIDYDPSVLTINLTDISTTGSSTQSWGGAWNSITWDAHDAEVLGSLSSVSAFGTSSASVVQLTFHVNSGASPGLSAVSVDPGMDNYGTYLYVGATKQAWSAINTQIDVQATPTITWSAPGAITYGTALSSVQLDATGSVAGTTVYSPVSGTVLGAGASQALQATFTPTDTTDYTNATATVSINVNKATTTVGVTSSTGGVSEAGQTVAFTAVVSCQLSVVSAPSGTVTFADGSTSLGTGSLNSSGVATFTTSSLTSGTHAITATYSGDTNFSGGTSSPMTQTVGAALEVTSFTPTATGFMATFNSSLLLVTESGGVTVPVLHLYDNAFGYLGAPDVTVVGSSTGPVVGSLVVSTPRGGPANSEVTFIQSGQTGIGQDLSHVGVLPNDTCTVTLRGSNADGRTTEIQDTNGNELEGSDGTVGDNYVTTFVVNNPTASVTVSLPDFMRGPGQPVDVQNNTDSDGAIYQYPSSASGVQNNVSGSGMPLSLHNNASTAVTVTSVTLSLAYNPSLLTITAITAVPGSATATLDTTSTSGLALITYTDPFGLVLGPVGDPGNALDFVHLTASVPTGATYGAKEILDLQSINMNQGAYTSAGGTALDDAAIHAVGFPGDTAMEGEYGVTNALYATQVAVSLQSGFRDWALVDPIVIGNVTGDGQVTVDDALALSQAAVNITPDPNPFPPITMTPVINGPDPLLSIGNSCQLSVVSCQSDVVQVPVMLDQSDGLTAIDLVIAYDSSRLSVSAADVQRGSLTAGFSTFTVRVDQDAGIIYISGYQTDGALLGQGAGSLATIDFHLKDNAPAGAAGVKLLKNVGDCWTVLGGMDALGDDFLFDVQMGGS